MWLLRPKDICMETEEGAVAKEISVYIVGLPADLTFSFCFVLTHEM